MTWRRTCASGTKIRQRDPVQVQKQIGKNKFYSPKEPDEEYDSDAGSVSDDLVGGTSADTPKEKKKKKVDKEKSEKKEKPAKSKEKDGKQKQKPEKDGKRKKKDPNAPKRNQVY